MHAASVRNWSQDYIQLSAGRFTGEIIEASVGPIQILKETIYQCVDERVAPHPDTIAVGVPIYIEENSYWQGYHLERDSFMTLRANEDLHFRTPRKSTILLAAIDCSALNTLAHETADIDIDDIITRSGATRSSPDNAQRFRATVNEVLTSIIATPEVCGYSRSEKAIVETILNASLCALRAQSTERKLPRSPQFVQRAIVERAREYILANRENPPTVTELSAHLKMSRRGLHHAFINILGINVATFLRHIRLHGVRKDLLLANSAESVSRIAWNWGFWHMGMFSCYYKRQFGELPSTTLRKLQPESVFSLSHSRSNQVLRTASAAVENTARTLSK